VAQYLHRLGARMSQEASLFIDRLSVGRVSVAAPATASAPRQPLPPGALWTDYAALVAALAPAPAPWPGAVAAFATGVLAEPLAPLSLREYAPAADATRLHLAIPGEVAPQYAPTLRDGAGRIIPYSPSVWFIDNLNDRLVFAGAPPATLGYVEPLSLTYWIYTGETAAGASGVPATVGGNPLANVGGGVGVYDGVSGNVAYLRPIAADPAPGRGGAVVSLAAGPRVEVGVTLTGANLGAGGAGVGQVFAAKNDGAATLELRRIVAGTGMGVAQTATDITLTPDVRGALNVGGGASLYEYLDAGNLRLRSLANGSGASATVAGDTVTLDCTLASSSLGGGVHVEAGRSGAALLFNTLVAGSGGISIAPPVGGAVVIDCTLAGATPGAGPNQVYSGKTGAALTFRSLVAGPNVVLTTMGDTITVAAAGAVADLLNVGGGAGVYQTLAGSTARLRSFVGDGTGVTITENTDTLTLSSNIAGANLGAAGMGIGLIYSHKSFADLYFRRIVGGAGVNVSQSLEDITLTAAGLVTIVNAGGGAEVYASSAGTEATLRTLTSDGTGVTATVAGNSIVLSAPLAGISLPGGAAVYAGKTGSNLKFRSLVGSGLVVTENTDTITISNSPGTTQYVTNAGGGGYEVAKGTIGGTTELRLIQAGSGMTIVQTTDALQLNAAPSTGANIGQADTPGSVATVCTTTVGPVINFRSVKAGTNMSVSTDGSGNIVLASSGLGANSGIGSITAASGGAVSVIQSVILGAATLRNIAVPNSASSGLTVTVSGDTNNVEFDLSLTGTLSATAASFSGRSLFKTRSAGSLVFHGLLGGTGISVAAANANDCVIITNTGVTSLTVGTFVAGGVSLLSGGPTGVMTLKRIVAITGSGVTVTDNGSYIVLDCPLTGGSAGNGIALFSSKSGGLLNFNSLVAGTGITLALSGGEITIAAPTNVDNWEYVADEGGRDTIRPRSSPHPAISNWSAPTNTTGSGGGTRIFFDGTTGAFRAGTVNNTQWNLANRGTASVAMGDGCIASGAKAVAMGVTCTASGANSFAMGNTSVASGINSVAMGRSCQATGDSSIALGYFVHATGGKAVAMGEGANASATNSVAIGYFCIADGSSSIALGSNNTANGGSAGALSGGSNTAGGFTSVVTGGRGNEATADYAAVVGGQSNTAGAEQSFVGGGGRHLVGNTATAAVIVGGVGGNATGVGSFIGGGGRSLATIATAAGHTASGAYSVVVGGGAATGTTAGAGGHVASGNYSVVVGGGGGALTDRNTASGANSFIGGGANNLVAGTFSTISCGINNTVNGGYSVVVGGVANNASANYSIVVGGSGNNASQKFSAVASGESMQAIAPYSFASAGKLCYASGQFSVCGGYNQKTGDTSYTGVPDTEFSTVGGSGGTIPPGAGSVLIGGGLGTNSGLCSFMGVSGRAAISGLVWAFADGSSIASGVQGAAIVAGPGHQVTANYGTIGGGRYNYVGGIGGVVAGGGTSISSRNQANGLLAAVGGGTSNTVTGDYSVIPGGRNNSAAGDGSFVAGTYASDNAFNGCFVFCDGNGGSTSGANNNNSATFRLGTGMATNSDIAMAIYTASGLVGTQLLAGGTSWLTISDAATKDLLAEADYGGVLDAVARLPVYEYTYKFHDGAAPPGTPARPLNRGPTAQDWHAAFPSGKDPLSIDTQDPAGVALAALRGAAARIAALEARIAALERAAQS
jgi:hypothetical protein